MQALLKQELATDPYRYFHSLFVLSITKDIQSYHHQVPYLHVCAAALMHDFSKHISIKQAQEYVKKMQIEIPQNCIDYPVCLHGFIASYKIQELFSITDNTIIEAVRYHTTGKPHLSTTGLIIYIADFLASIIQKNTTLFQEIYFIAQDSLYEAARKINENKIQYLQEKNLKIHPLSLDFHEWLVSKLSKN